MARSGTLSTRRQQTLCQRQLPSLSVVSRGTSTPRISSEGTHVEALSSGPCGTHGPLAASLAPGGRPREAWGDVQKGRWLLPGQETLTLSPVDAGFPEHPRQEGDGAVPAPCDEKDSGILKQGSGRPWDSPTG